MDEKALVTKAVTGDKEAFASLYMLYRDSLYRYAYYRLGNDADAEDAVSACIVQAYESIYSLRAEKAFKAWIFRILYRCCCAAVREQSEAAQREGEEALESLPSPEGDRISPELMDAFDVLSPRDRDIVLLSVIAGYNSREIGSMLDMRPATVRSRLSRGLIRMRTYLMMPEL